jgi:hypothetical protein
VWSGSGELLPRWWIRWFCPRERVAFSSRAVWLSPTIWLVHDRFEFSSGRVVEGTMFSELRAPDRIHVTADHMPQGADIHLTESGFRFTPYRVAVAYRGIVFQLRLLDECRVDRDGFVHDRIRRYWRHLPVGELRIGPICRDSHQE